MKIKDIVFREDLYPRFEPSQNIIKKYSESIEQLPPIKIDLFSLILKNVTSVVSKIGYPRTRIGRQKDRLILSVSQLPSIAMHANVNPRNMLPESPMKIFAFGKLCFKNPKHAPAKANERIAT